jgi:putative transposase
VIDELIAGARTEDELVGYEPHQEPPGGTGNTRNGSTAKTLATDHSRWRSAPHATATPASSRRSSGRGNGVPRLRDKILALYSRGLSISDIEAHLREIYGVDVGRDLISRVTDEVMEDGREWRQRPLDDVYPVLYLDALVLKIREGGSVQRKACYLDLGVTVEGERDVLGIWLQDTEDAKFWMQVLNELKQRGVRDILICFVDRLKASLPRRDRGDLSADDGADVHRASHRQFLRYVPRKDYDQVVQDLRPIYIAVDADAAQQALERFDEKSGARFPVITQHGSTPGST